jgi:hypothetical protein
MSYTPTSAAAPPAKDRFQNLCAEGILPRSAAGRPIPPADTARAQAFLNRCRRTKRPNVHTTKLQRLVGVGPGAIIAAAVGLGFEVRGWYGIWEFFPHALIGVNRFDVRRAMA